MSENSFKLVAHLEDERGAVVSVEENDVGRISESVTPLLGENTGVDFF
ncbi:hypothetical protein IID19_03160 [Patescibacteria group bacterium]|nr:hypothetical protein [Patescibacteria group bacterium]